MRSSAIISFILFFLICSAIGQSGRVREYSESSSPKDKSVEIFLPSTVNSEQKHLNNDEETIRVDTDLVIIPSQISDRSGKPVNDIAKEEFKIFENGIEQEIAYFSSEEQPFTVALVLDMSYSSVFKLPEIQAAALAFINQLHENDKVMVVSFDEKIRILCEATTNRKALRLAVEGARIASGTSLYEAMDTVLNKKLRQISGRKAVILLSDGVDTSSQRQTPAAILRDAAETEVLIYPIRYDTYDDVQKSRKESAQIFYDENDRPYTVETSRVKGERIEDYRNAKEFTEQIASQSGGKVYRVSRAANLNRAFSQIAEELRQVYNLGYYPNSERKNGVLFSIKVRVYRSDLIIRARNSYFWKSK
ncbi:MAG: VWA domain-containing protein [Pyrinomonadaceae bacterium]|nr:VWA domain-containing protein [Pyrinomonadaceae bacterium]